MKGEENRGRVKGPKRREEGEPPLLKKESKQSARARACAFRKSEESEKIPAQSGDQ